MGLVDTNEAVEHFRRFIEATENNGAYNEGFIDALEFCIATLSTMPAAELIHCKDCKHWICHDRRCGCWNHGVKMLDWCCHAERRTNEVRAQ